MTFRDTVRPGWPTTSARRFRAAGESTMKSQMSVILACSTADAGVGASYRGFAVSLAITQGVVRTEAKSWCASAPYSDLSL